MRIGILTLPFNNNYGGYLQAYALIMTLKNIGHEPELIYRKQNRRSIAWRSKYFIMNTIKICLGYKHGNLIPNQETELRSKGQMMMHFVDRYIVPRTKPLYSTKELKQCIEGRYDAIIVGSDQVWRPDYVPDIENFYLTFLSGKTQRIAYAASFGTDKPIYSDYEKEICGQGLELFNFVSVREKSALQVISDFGWQCQTVPKQVLDPTMLLDNRHYEGLIKTEPSYLSGKIFCYILDENDYTRKMVRDVSSALGKEPYYFFGCDHLKKGYFVLPSIECWLSAFRDADFVVTDSFHGTVFSIIFNKPFIACINKRRGADRFDSLLSTFGISNCLYSEGMDYLPVNIDWEKVNGVLDQKRTESLTFLKQI